jgi:CBS domain-containing protein
MRVEQIMSRQVSTCSAQDTLERAAGLMWNSDCGCLPVCDGNGNLHVRGVVTDRDICMAALFQGRSLQDLRVEEAMSKSVESCSPGDSIAEAEQKMQASQVRRLPVIADNGSLVGIISMADIAREANRQQHSPRHDISTSEVGTTYAAICSRSGDRLAA